MNGYFNWLKEQVDFLDFSEKYDRLFSILQKTSFFYFHPMDRNRAMDGMDLRTKYHETTGRNAIGRSIPTTVLEVLVSLAQRMNYICSSFEEDKTKIIFWRLLANLDLAKMSDPYYEKLGGDDAVKIILDRWIKRDYESDGRGGIFPMVNPRENQREVELWYQMNQYLSDPNGEDLKSY